MRQFSKDRQSQIIERFEEIRLPEIYEQLWKFSRKVVKVLKDPNNTFQNYGEEKLSSCLLYGPAGTGKTIEIANRIIQFCRNQRLNGSIFDKFEITTLPDLFQEVKSTYGNKEKSETEVLEKYKKVELLVLDDFGIIKNSDWCYDLLYVLLDYRYRNEKVTFYTSNLSIPQLADRISDDRIPSRIQHDCGIENIIKFTNRSKRL